jgi:hypothetical protein
MGQSQSFRGFVDPNDIRKIRKSFNTGKEIGGVMVLDEATGMLKMSEPITGEKTSINLPLSRFEYHTHPNKCLNKRKCALGTPSLEDLENIYDRGGDGNCVHFVFAHEGLYAVSLKPAHRGVFRQLSNPQNPRPTFRQVSDLTNKFYQSGLTGMPYRTFRRRWMVLLNSTSSPFVVNFVSKNAKPPVSMMLDLNGC